MRGHRVLASLVALLVVSPLGGGVLAAQAAPAAAGPPACDPGGLGLAADFTEFVRHDAARVGHSEGRVAIGGNARLGARDARTGFTVGADPSVDVGAHLGLDAARADVVVGGRLTAYDLLLARGGARFGSLDDQGEVRLTARTPGARVGVGTAVDFPAEFAALDARAKAWAGLTPTGQAVLDGGALTLTGEDDTGAVVFTVDADQLAAAAEIRIRVAAGVTALVNVTGAKYDTAAALKAVLFWDGGAWVDASAPAFARFGQHLLWNFPEATHLAIQGTAPWPGLVLAPHARLTLGAPGAVGHVFGGFAVDSVVTVGPGVHTHFVPFRGACLPRTATSDRAGAGPDGGRSTAARPSGASAPTSSASPGPAAAGAAPTGPGDGAAPSGPGGAPTDQKVAAARQERTTGDLASTGADVMWTALAAVVLLGVGGTTLVLARRRGSAVAAAPRESRDS
ncbi:choice-of-anchor A family protein [Streptoalloteichus hindustanus]|uniref:Choice-of-anchor A domain-containing protein n=1 Tax=Streptoalloteichus hindustanus TaxID=2017 RepID=A0A1M5IWP7_STRHI|nr:choice-of-anchor A family protein [Streptoalloteichus hindustanus]SHG32681.1 choice-of-anchor A domain-containing protein [Streptoalloteichus hindustanus]